MKCLFRFLLSAFGIVTLVTPSDAGETPPPQQLLAKSIVVTWSENRVQRDEDEAKFKSVHATQNLSVYIGTSGRVFSRMNIATGAGSGRADHVQEKPASEPKFRERVTTFSGQSMTVFLPFRQGGMRRLVVDVGDKFDSCSAKASYVTEPGSPTSLGRSVITHKMVEFQSITMSGETCSVLSRNVFADE